MIRRLIAAGALVLAVFAQDIFPGRAFYHSGIYALTLAAMLLFVILRVRALRSRAPSIGRAYLLIALGAGIVGFAGIASGLLGPDNQTEVGAPGSSLPVADLNGSLQFPLASENDIELRRNGHPDTSIGGHPRYIGGFIVTREPRLVAFVEARDLLGAHLTITQPTGTFLSPVLLFEKRETKLSTPLPVDSFTLPAAHRVVGAYLFSADQIAALRHLPAHANGQAGVLFDVYTDTMRRVPNATRLVFSGTSEIVGDLRLGCAVKNYPAIAIYSAPYLPALWIGLLLCVAGSVLLTVKSPSRY